jgi:hypothetical protein
VERQADKRVAAKLDEWKFTNQMYKQLPNDIVALSRGLELTAENGAVAISKGDKYQVRFTTSNVTQIGDVSFTAKAQASGVVGMRSIKFVLYRMCILIRVHFPNPS